MLLSQRWSDSAWEDEELEDDDSAGAARKRMTLFGKDHRVEPDPPGDLLPLEAGEVDDEVPHLVP